MTREQDPYCYPGTDLLRNKPDLKSHAALERFERVMVRERMATAPLDFPISDAGCKDIHRYLFQDVYDWAGETRTARRWNITKDGAEFTPAPFVDVFLKRHFLALNAEDNLRGLSAGEFADRAAVHASALNVLHPFREGNGRTLRFFLKVLAHQAGHKLDLRRIDGPLWMEGSVVGLQTGETELLSMSLRPALGLSGRTRSRQD